MDIKKNSTGIKISGINTSWLDEDNSEICAQNSTSSIK